MNRQEFLANLATLLGERRWPKPLHALEGLRLVSEGVGLEEASRRVRTTPKALARLVESRDPVRDVLGLGPEEVDVAQRQRTGQMLGQLLLGRCAETVFEDLIAEQLKGEGFRLRDVRIGRTDTDYRLLNGRDRPVYRFNIKFHGSPFRRAKELVGLDPPDCFALATYKIFSALEKQNQEGLPYVFSIVGVPHLTGDGVGQLIPSQLVETVAFVDQAPKGKGKRDFEDSVVNYLVDSRAPIFVETKDRIRAADWFIMSAARANRLLHEQLFERVYAMRLRGFARAFRGAELDMHFSLASDLTRLEKFLETLRKEGPHKVTTLMSRGDF